MANSRHYRVIEGHIMMSPRITIGICARNCEAYIRETIESVEDQDFPHELMELIFVDDGSEDRTSAIINEQTHSIDTSLKIFHTEWKGIGHARNIVIENARAEYVLWVDGDMVLSRGFVKESVEFMDSHPEVAIAKGKQALRPGGNWLATVETYARAASRMLDYESDAARSKSLGTGGAIQRINVLRQVGGFDENLRGYAEDFDLEIRVRDKGYLLSTIDSEFQDYERRGLTWKILWSKYWLRGYYSYYFSHKNKGIIKHHRMFPPAAFVAGLLHAPKLYRLTHQKVVFLVPIENMFKIFAWYCGFLKSQDSRPE
jgi:glycosyltransferase involved in cell wall biosynthesis